MADVTLTYNGQNILEMSASGTRTLKTAGKICKTDVGITYVRPSGGDVEPLLPSEYQRVEYLQFEPSIGIVVTIPTIGYVCYAADIISTKTNSSEDYSIVFGFRESSSTSTSKDFELGATYQAVYSWIRYSGTDTGLEMYHNETYTPGNRKTVYITLKSPRSTALIGRYAYYNSVNVNSEAFKGKFYSLKGTNIATNRTVAWFVPCYRKSDNQVGVYDHIAQAFFWQTFATGSNYGITAGPDIVQ